MKSWITHGIRMQYRKWNREWLSGCRMVGWVSCWHSWLLGWLGAGAHLCPASPESVPLDITGLGRSSRGKLRSLQHTLSLSHHQKILSHSIKIGDQMSVYLSLKEIQFIPKFSRLYLLPKKIFICTCRSISLGTLQLYLSEKQDLISSDKVF